MSFVYALPVTDTTVHLLAGSGDTNATVVTKWTTAQGSAPVDAVNDLLKNHATASMSAGGVALGTLAHINDGLMLSGGKTSDSTDGLALFTNNGGWPSSGPADLVFTLDANYDIARIDSFTLWDPSRTGQKYDLYGSTDGGANWIFVTSVNKDSGTAGSNRDVRRISLANAGEVIPGLAGVNALKFHIMDPGPNGATSNNSIYADIAAYALTSGSDYTTWLGEYTFAGGADTTPTGDPDGDGLNNQQEYAFGLDPTSGSSVSPISQQFDKTRGIFKYTRRKNSGLTYIYQWSTTLSEPWTDFTPLTNPPAAASMSAKVEEVTIEVPAAQLENSNLFLRVKAE